MVARGYLEQPELGRPSMDCRAAAGVPGASIFEAATQIDPGRLLAAGGCVLTIAATGPSVAAASAAAYSAIGRMPARHRRGLHE